MEQEKLVNKSAHFIGFSDFCDIGNAVCQIETWDGTTMESEMGSGFYTKVKIGGMDHYGIFTNNHVIPSLTGTRTATAIFGFDKKDREVTKIKLKPDLTFRTNKPLDYSFVGLNQDEINQLPNIKPLKLQEATEVKAPDQVTIIQHPKGRPKEFCPGNITKVDETFVYYDANTEPGSSGSPVLKTNEVIALHHTGDESANRGTLFSEIIKHLKTGKYSSTPNSAKTASPGKPPDKTSEKPIRKDLNLGTKVAGRNMDPKTLRKLSPKLVGCWKDLGYELGVDEFKLEEISMGPDLPTDKAHNMLKAWSANCPQDSQCSILIHALREIKQSRLADDLEADSPVGKTEMPKNGSSAERHDREPTDQDFLLIQSVGNKYEELGMHLGVPTDVLQEIKDNTNLQTPSKKALAMLKEWRNRDEAPSCRKLAEGLKIENVGRGDLARKLLKQL